jgi:hypothetical protein
MTSLEYLIGKIAAGYTSPITIALERQTISHVEKRFIDKGRLTLSDLSFVGKDEFTISEASSKYDGFNVQVFRSRLETEEERQTRVQLEALYMQEYKRRNPGAEK